jgi:methionyl-tRNA formyltransferase
MVDGLKVVFFGTPVFAVPTLEAILASRHRVVAVVTQPDRRRGRGHKTSDAPVKAVALAHKLAILQPERLADQAFLDAFTALGADVGVVAAYGKILSERLLAIPRRGMLNVHASLLPKYRGAAPVHRAVMNGDPETGVTIMRIVKALDAGPMLLKATRAVDADETSEAVERALADLGAGLLVRALDDLAAGRTVEVPQRDEEATYAHRLTKEEGLMNWSASAEHLHNRIRGLHPWPHAYSFVKGHRLILLRSSWSAASPANARPGTICEVDSDRLTVAAGSGALHLLRIQAEGKRAMEVGEFLTGHPLHPGDHFEPR